MGSAVQMTASHLLRVTVQELGQLPKGAAHEELCTKEETCTLKSTLSAVGIQWKDLTTGAM